MSELRQIFEEVSISELPLFLGKVGTAVETAVPEQSVEVILTLVRREMQYFFLCHHECEAGVFACVKDVVKMVNQNAFHRRVCNFDNQRNAKPI